MKIVKISEVKTNPNNPRVIKDNKFRKLVRSIQDFPDMLHKRPLVVYTDADKKYVVLGGNMRLKACQELGLKEIPVIIADDWTEEQRKEFLIKDNVSFGEWDFDSLANEWEVEQLDDWGVDIGNFASNDIELFETTEAPETEKEPKGTDDGYSVYELVMLHENKILLLETLNKIKTNFMFEKQEDALMELVRMYNN